MFIRCTHCHTALWVESSHYGQRALAGACHGCNQAYRLETEGHSESAGRNLQRRARGYAIENGIDLPSAYSIVIGILSLDDVMDLAGQQTVPDPVIGESVVPTRGPLAYDPEFRPAVESGFLTPAQALDRGNRDALAAKIGGRHRLSGQLAYEVADNRISLLAAIRLREKEDTEREEERSEITVRLEQSGARRFPLRAAAALVLLLMATTWAIHAWYGAVPDAPEIAVSELPGPAGPASASTAADRNVVLMTTTRVDRDEQGRVSRVEGPDPRSVLIAYCEQAEPDGLLEPFELAPAVPPSVTTRLGLIRDFEHPDALFAIDIRRNRETRRWSAGDGSAPVARVPAPQTAVEFALRR